MGTFPVLQLVNYQNFILASGVSLPENYTHTRSMKQRQNFENQSRNGSTYPDAILVVSCSTLISTVIASTGNHYHSQVNNSATFGLIGL
jgi:hypothetical protein